MYIIRVICLYIKPSLGLAQNTSTHPTATDFLHSSSISNCKEKCKEQHLTDFVFDICPCISKLTVTYEGELQHHKAENQIEIPHPTPRSL